ncbi:MAG: TrmJ/YjtD family RNA methyltransferase [Thermoproteales archaeon]|nr:TrmJ/YjtD family RNA methyltransferase [Thermoproteales archaeon]
MLVDKVSVAIIEPLYEMNIGYIARTMKNFDIKKLYIVNPRCEIGETARMYASHAQDIINNIIIVNSFKELTKKFNFIVGTTGKIPKRPSIIRRYIYVDRLAEIISNFSGKFLIVFGREDIGLKNDELELCDVVANIETSQKYPILNISHAAAIIFYEIFKKSKEKYSTPEKKLPSRKEIDLFLKYIEYSLKLQGKKKESISRAILKIKRLIGECPFTENDLRLMLGIIRELYEKASSVT